MAIQWLGQRGEKLIERALDPKANHKDWKNSLKKLEKGKSLGLGFQRWTRYFVSGFFGVAVLGLLSMGAVKTITQNPKPTNQVNPANPAPAYTYKQHEEDQNHRAAVFLFGDSVGSSIVKWSNYFNIDPSIVVAILCAENGSSLDQQILNTVSRKFAQNPHVADQTHSVSGARGIAQIKPGTAERTIKRLVRKGRWPFKTTEVEKVLSDYDMSIFLLCALIQEIETSGYADVRNIAGIYHSGHNGWRRKKARGQDDDEVWKQIKKAELAKHQYDGVRAYLNESQTIKNE